MEHLENVALVVAPWSPRTAISKGWVDWDGGRCTEEERGRFVILTGEEDVIAHVVGLWNSSGVSVPSEVGSKEATETAR